MTTQEQGQQESKEALRTEAAELETDIKEAETDAAAARVAGDDDRAMRLETAIAETKAELREIKALLKQQEERPFHRAPGDGETETKQEQGQGQEPETKQGQEQDAPDPKPKKKHWLYGERWNQE